MAHYNQKGRKNQDRRDDRAEPAEGHRSKTPSKQEKHEAADTRRATDRGGERGDQRRRGNPNKSGGRG